MGEVPASLGRYLASVVSAVLGVDAGAVEGGLRRGGEAVELFWVDPSEEARLVAETSEDGEVRFSKELSPGAAGVVVLAKRSGGGDGEDAGSRVHVVFSWQRREGGREAVLAAARRVVGGALRPLVEEASDADDSASLASVRQRVRDLDAALASCDARRALPEARLVAPAAVVAALREFPEPEAAAAAATESSSEEVAEACASAAAQWAKDAFELASLCESLEDGRLAFPGGIEAEVGLWVDYEAAVRRASEARRSSAAKCVASILKRSKRFVAAAQLEDGMTSLSRAAEIAGDATKVLGELPAAELEAGASLETVASATSQFFLHLAKLRASRHYPARRAAKLVEAASRSLSARAARLLADKDLLELGYDAFCEGLDEADGAFVAARKGVRRFREVASELSRRDAPGRGGISSAAATTTILVGKDLAHEALEARVAELREFRKSHRSFREALAKVLRDGGEAVGELDAAYARLGVQAKTGSPPVVVDASPEGSARWRSAREEYAKRLDKSEALAAARLAARLDAARSADETFEVFALFQPLLERPAVRRAARRHQAALVEHVRLAVEELRDACTQRYEGSNAEALASVRDAPPVAAKIAWARQVENRLRRQMRRLGDVLGDDADRHPSGRALRSVADELLRHLDARPLFEAWLDDCKQRRRKEATTKAAAAAAGLLLKVVGDEPPALAVAFDASRIALFKEVSQLRWLGFRVPETISLVADEARDRYPTAVALHAATRAYAVASKAAVPKKALVAPWLRAVRDRVALAFPRRPSSQHHHHHHKNSSSSSSSSSKFHAPKVSWTSPTSTVRAWVDALAEDVSALQEKLDVLAHASREFDAGLEALAQNDDEDAETLHGRLQAILDRLSLEGLEGLDAWARDARRRALRAVRDRLARRLAAWTKRPESASPQHRLEVVEGADGARLAVVPELGFARRRWHDEISREFAVLSELPALGASRFDALDETSAAKDDDDDDEEEDNRRRGGGHAVLDEAIGGAVAAVEAAVDDARRRAAAWARFVAVWRTPAPVAASRLLENDDLDAWTRLVSAASTDRAALDDLAAAEAERLERLRGTPAVECALDARPAADRIRPRVDAWISEVRAHLAARAGAISNRVRDACRGERDVLESLDDRACREALEAMARCDALEARKLAEWRGILASLERAEALIPPEDREMESSRVREAIDELEQLADRKGTALARRAPQLARDLERELEAASRRAAKLADRWRRLKPDRLSTTTSPRQALEALKAFGVEVEAARADADALERAGAVLAKKKHHRNNSDDASYYYYYEAPGIARDLEAILTRELPALAEVWERLAGPAETSARFDATRWPGLDPAAARSWLREADEALRSAPPRIRQYEAFSDAVNAVATRERALVLLAEIKAAEKNLGEAGWGRIAAAFGVPRRWDTRTIGTLVARCLEPETRSKVDAALAAARQDAALSEYLDEVHDTWENFELEIVGDRLVSGWDLLFSRLDDDATGLRAMRDATHFRRAVDDGDADLAARRQALEARCDELRRRLELWAEAQRRWVHLDAVSLDRVPDAASKFQEADRLFSAAKRDALAADPPRAKHLLLSPKLPDHLGAIASLLADAQRCLGDHLEATRAKFPRFYLLGDDDLLSVLGNAPLDRHLPKMFQAIDGLVVVVENNNTASMMMRSGLELVPLENNQNFDVKGSRGADAIPRLTFLEKAMRAALSRDLKEALETFGSTASCRSDEEEHGEVSSLAAWLGPRTAQAAVLASQISWARDVERQQQGAAAAATTTRGGGGGGGGGVLERVLARLRALAEDKNNNNNSKKKNDDDDDYYCEEGGRDALLWQRKREQFILDLAAQRDASLELARTGATANEFAWLRQLRLYAGERATVDDAPRISGGLAVVASGRVLDASLSYCFEYQGVGERLVRTPLTDRCFVCLAMALRLRLGASPIGPAGTGKTQSVRDFGAQLGRHVVVFNCDEAFSVAAMGRLLKGIASCGAFAVFDEFNRLEPKMLSAVSEQLEAIQVALQKKKNDRRVELSGVRVPLEPTTAVFVTMNPGYAGRSPLPENLKALFRTVAMVAPDARVIARVALDARGFGDADALAGALVSLLELCRVQLSARDWYDFGLRALGPVLRRAGVSLRAGATPVAAIVAALRATISPRLVDADSKVFDDLLAASFDKFLVVARDAAGSRTNEEEEEEKRASSARRKQRDAVRDAIRETEVRSALDAAHRAAIGAPASPRWLDKASQLRNVLSLACGAVVVGTAGCGKTTLWRAVAAALEKLDGTPTIAYVVDPKAFAATHYKDLLFGSLDETTIEWRDGWVTALLRGINSNERGELSKRHWIVLDGDIDPEWAENLNSVLDDNRILTLPNGERLGVPQNVRFLFEVDDLKRATPATVSRCGVLFVDDALATVPERFAAKLVAAGLDDDFGRALAPLGEKWVARVVRAAAATKAAKAAAAALEEEEEEDDAIVPFAAPAAQIVDAAVAFCASARDRATALNDDAPQNLLESYARGALVAGLFWAAGAARGEAGRGALDRLLKEIAEADAPRDGEVGDSRLEARPASIDRASFWRPWLEGGPDLPLESFDAVVRTQDTERHEWLIAETLAAKGPTPLLVGPPGSGKTMTVERAVAKRSEAYALVPLACASGTTAVDVARLLAEHCELVRDGEAFALVPKRGLYGTRRSLVFFLDEINLVSPDAYGTPRALAFLRQLVERRGFWALSTTSARAALEPSSSRSSSRSGGGKPRFVRLDRILFVAACNPPSDAGRRPLPRRLARHALAVRVGTPSRAALARIYGAFADLALRPMMRRDDDDDDDDNRRRGGGGSVRPHAVAEAMLDVYEANAARFGGTAPQCVYSARDATRWCRRLRAALDETARADSWSSLFGGGGGFDETAGLARLWAHEGLRLFGDRLARREDRMWVRDTIDEVALRRFPRLDPSALRRPILFSSWLSRAYAPARRRDLRAFVSARLRTFYEEEPAATAPLCVLDDVVDHVLRIDSVLRAQSEGHLLLVGESGVGKSILTRFVAWNAGFEVVEIRATRNYSLANFDDDLKSTMRRAGLLGERLCLLLDEADAVSSAFLERTNALLASGEIPGLFSTDETTALLSACRDNGAGPEADDATALAWFSRRVRRNLHCVFSIDPGCGGGGGGGLFFEDGPRATASPALFNRCVTLWFETWTPRALAHLADAHVRDLDLEAMAAAAAAAAADWSDDDDDDLLHHDSDSEEDDDSDDSEDSDSSMMMKKKEEEAPAAASCSPPRLGRFRARIVTALARTHAFAAGELSGGATARDFLELVWCWKATCEKKRDEEASAQRRRLVGLRELEEAKARVAKMQSEERAAVARLEEQDAIARAQLERMMASQREAEAKQRDGEKASRELEEHAKEIERRKREAEAALAEAEPAVERARAAVGAINRKQLDEVRALRTPPVAVRRTLEAVEVLMGLLAPSSSFSYAAPNWDEVRKLTRRGDFIGTVVAFEPSQLREAEYVKERYLAPSETTLRELTKAARAVDPDAKPVEALEPAAVAKASKACGPLVEWAASQIAYADVERAVAPLRAEVADLEFEAERATSRVASLDSELADLGEAIARYKREYAEAVGAAERIKAEISTGRLKTERAERLLKSLETERARWASEARAYPDRVGRLAADALRVASVVAYAGPLDAPDRARLEEKVDAILCDLRLLLEENDDDDDVLPPPRRRRRRFDVATYAHSAAKIREWHDAFGLAREARSVENAAILASARRVALIVDPAGSALEFVEAMLAADRPVSTCEAADPNFAKILATAARFGGALVVRGVDDDSCWDAIAHPVLDRCASRSSRRAPVRLGADLVDVSPDLVLVLHATDSDAAKKKLPRALLGRVVLVDFSTTPQGLEQTVLSRILRRERPDLERQRVEAVRDLDDARLRLSRLEDDVLERIGAEILDDDAALEALEHAQAEARAARIEAERGRAALDDLRNATAAYAPAARFITKTRAILDRLSRVRASYAYSLGSFLEAILAPALLRIQPPSSSSQSSSAPLFDRVAGPFLTEFSRRIARGLVSRDHRLAAASALARLLLLEKNTTQDHHHHRKLDAPAIEATVRAVLGPSASEPWLAAPDGDNVADAAAAPPKNNNNNNNNNRAATIVLLTGTGRDGARDVEKAARRVNAQLEAVALGPSESLARADAALRRASDRGSWVFLGNAHLAAREWLDGLDRRRGSTKSKKEGLVFLAADPDLGGLPRSLLARSDLVALGAETGLRAALSRHAGIVDPSAWRRKPAERPRLYAILALLHSVLVERVRRYPRAFSKRYEWGDVDALVAVSVVDQLLNPLSEADHVDPQALPWGNLAGGLEAVYGSRLEDDHDARVLGALVSKIVSPDAFSSSSWTFCLSDDAAADSPPALPDGCLTPDSWLDWIRALPADNPCSWLGLAPEAEISRARDARRALATTAAILCGSDAASEEEEQEQEEQQKTTRIRDEDDDDGFGAAETTRVFRALRAEKSGLPVRLGALRWPSRLLAAARLDDAANSNELFHDLFLHADDDDDDDGDDKGDNSGVLVDGLFARGASWRDARLSLAPPDLHDATGAVALPPLRLSWRRRTTTTHKKDVIVLPLRTTATTTYVAFPTHEDEDTAVFYLRNVVVEARRGPPLLL
ncbi:hypothetical protein CTAYLR_010108 [Chrysophaeum taylorii]|uniref:Dynein heavy chain, cytoplasmic n=1 Tax=Chrysophaeum taylorii TaxID=2483200 RepID=A0AAD7XHM0_9STRA|nr:hypothetical protein CTAYLR_010108 [Chrysophaeum taylorii]